MLLKTQPRSVSPHTGCCRQLHAQNTDVVPNTVANAFELNEQELVVSGILSPYLCTTMFSVYSTNTSLFGTLLDAVVSRSPGKDDGSVHAAMPSYIDEYLSHRGKSASMVSTSSSMWSLKFRSIKTTPSPPPFFFKYCN